MGYLDFSGVLSRTDLLLEGVKLTVEVSLVAMFFALILGIVGALLSLSRWRILRFISLAYVEAIRNTPFIVQLFMIYFGLPSIGVHLEPIPAAIIAMSIYGGAYTSEIIRGGIQSIDRGQIESAKALGMSPYQIFRYIILQPALSAVFLSVSAQFILLLLSSSVVSAISVPELTGIGNDIQGMTLRNLEIYLVIAFIYVSLVAILKGSMQALERVFFPFKFAGR